MPAEKFSNPVVRWVDHRLPIFSMLDHEKYDYPVPKNLNYFWNFGVLAGMALVIMIVTGIVVASLISFSDWSACAAMITLSNQTSPSPSIDRITPP